LRKDHGLRYPDVRFTGKVFWINVLPELVGQPLGLGTGRGVGVQAPEDNPIPEVLQMAIANPRITVKLQKKCKKMYLRLRDYDAKCSASDVTKTNSVFSI
jgi:hypothetical protein